MEIPLADKIELPPLQIVEGEAVALLIIGKGFTVTSILFDAVIPHELVVDTEYVPEVVTLMLGVVTFVLQTPPLFPDKVTEPPAQNVVAPLAVIVDAVGKGFTVTGILAVAVQP